MADSPMNVGVLSQDEERAIDDEVSSGSDQPFEADDDEANSKNKSRTLVHQIHTESLRSRRKRRQGSHGSRRHKGGSRHKHKGYQPYTVKDNGEFQLKRKSIELQEKENAAAVVRNEGPGQFVTFPVAPFNSTQFLMDEHCDTSQSDLHKFSIHCAPSSCSPQDIRIHSIPSTPAESSHDTITFEKKDTEFTDFFTKAHADSLQSLPKEELVKHYINLEEKIAVLQKKVAEHQQKQDEDLYARFDRHSEKVCDSNCNSDANSLSSSNEEFLDLSTVNQTSDCVHDSGDAISSFSGNIKLDSGDNLS